MSKINYDNEFLARIYGAYMGCDIAQWVDKKNGVFGKLVSVEQDRCFARMNSKTISFSFYKNTQLLLKPLSMVNAKDAIEVAKIFFADNVGTVELTAAGGINIVEGIFSVKYIHPIISAHQFTAILDYLRSKSYDCGYAHIPSLIEAGIAIETTTP